MKPKKKRNKRRMWIILAAIFLALTAFFIWQNNDIVLTRIDYDNTKIPSVFDGFKILEISDLHSKTFGRDQEPLISLTKKCEPDIIVITGDLIDGHYTDMDAAIDYVSKAVKIAPVYYVSGNQEWLSGKYDELCDRLKAAGVIMMDDTRTELKRDDAKICLLGAEDPVFDGDKEFKEKLEEASRDLPGFTILLSHHPEKINLYVEDGFDLVLTGHAHGGQIRLPFIGGLFAPGQGWFPKYTTGMYQAGNTSMVVSRGLGNSIFPLRVFNRPELVLVTLHAAG